MLTTRLEAHLPTFGISLRLLCDRSGIEVPLILGDILRWLAAHALAQPDVFAQQSRSAVTSHLKCAIDSGVTLVESVEGTHPAVVGSLLKRWLEELPNPLLNWDQQVELLSACKDEGCIEARIASLNDAIALVDPVSLGTLKPLLLFLQQYCFRQRRFDQQLLQVAVAFAPILFPAALAAGPAELRLAEETVATLVSNALHVFNPTLAANVPVVTPQALSEAAAEVNAMETSCEDQTHLALDQQPAQLLQKAAQLLGQGGSASAAAVDAAKAAAVAAFHNYRAQQPYELVDDVALMSIDQRLQQRQPEQQQDKAAQQATARTVAEQGTDVTDSSRQGFRTGAQANTTAANAQLLAVRRDDGVEGAPDTDIAAGGTSDAASFEPYLSDATFLASFSVMVESCVASALFALGPDVQGEGISSCGGRAEAHWRMAREHVGVESESAAVLDSDDHCGSSAPSACPSDTMLSSMGGDSATSSTGGKSSGGGSTASCEEHESHHRSGKANSALAGVISTGYQLNPNHRHLAHHERHGAPKHMVDNVSDEPPYSPRAVLITPPEAGDELAQGPGVRVSGHGSSNASRKSTAVAAVADLAELAHREVSEGSVICFISAAPGTAAAAGSEAAGPGGIIVGGAASNAVRTKQQSAQQVHQHQHHHVASAKGSPRGGFAMAGDLQLQQQPAASVAGMALCAAAPAHSEARLGSCKRHAEGGATGAPDALQQTEVAEQQRPGQHGGPSGHPYSGSVAPGDLMPRRMTMGGGEASCASNNIFAGPAQNQLLQLGIGAVSNVAAPNSTASAPHPQQQHQGPPTRQRPNSGPNSSSAHRSTGTSAGRGTAAAPCGDPQTHPPAAAVSAVIVALQGHHRGSGWPAPSPPSSPFASGHIAELGVAGHLRVSLTSAHTLAVRELTTPEALAHRMPIRSLAAPALQAEKERLKRQLKDVAAAYEALAGQSLVPALKEPLRPVYVRYHKIKALLSSGRAAAGAQATGGGVSAAASRQQALRA